MGNREGNVVVFLELCGMHKIISLYINNLKTMCDTLPLAFQAMLRDCWRTYCYFPSM